MGVVAKSVTKRTIALSTVEAEVMTMITCVQGMMYVKSDRINEFETRVSNRITLPQWGYYDLANK